MTIIKACAADSSLLSEADLRWVAQKLASEAKTSKLISRKAATSFGAFVSVADLGSMTVGKSGKIKWKVAPSQILHVSSTYTPSNSEQGIDEAQPLSASAEMRITQPTAQSMHQPPSFTPPIYKKRQAVFSQEEINGGFSIGSSYLATATDMTN